MRIRTLLLASVLAVSNSLYAQKSPTVRSVFDTPGDLNLVAPPTISISRTGTVSSTPISVARLRHKVPKAAAALLRKALSDLKSGHTDLAIQHLQEAVKLDPGYWDAQTRLADLYWKRKQPGAALDRVEAALRIDPDSEILQSDRTVALLALGRAEEAEQAARDAIRLEPSSEDARYLLALARLRQGKPSSETLDFQNK